MLEIPVSRPLLVILFGAMLLAGGPGAEALRAEDLGLDGDDFSFEGGDLGDDFGGDLGDEDLGDDFGGDFGGDLGGDFGGDLGGDFGGDLDSGSGADPFGSDDPFTHLSAGPDLGGGPATGEESDELTAFADLLDELRQRGVPRPLHGIARHRLQRWAARAGAGLLPGDDLVQRARGLAEAGGDLARSFPLGEGDRIAALRNPSSAIVAGLGAARTDPGLPEAPAATDEDCQDDPFGEGCLDLGFDDDLGEGDLGGFGDDLGALGELEPTPAVAGSAPDLFRIFRMRRRMAAEILAPASPAEWARFLGGEVRDVEVLADGLGDLVGTRLGADFLPGLAAGSLSREGALALADAIGEHGDGTWLPVLESLRRFGGEVATRAGRAAGRVEERALRVEGLRSSERRRLAEVLLAQAHDLARARKFPAALRVAEDAVRAMPESGNARVRVGLYAYQIGYFQRAREALEVALRRGTDAPVAYTTYAKVLRRQGESDALRRFLEEAMKHGGHTDLKVRIANELALEHSLAGDGAEAVKLARIGLNYFVPQGVEDNLWTRYAEGKLLLGEIDAAITAFEKALALDPNYRKARVGLEVARASRGAASTGWLR